jgi:uncharacterized protein YndB with AHSA1/START domain
MSEKEFAPIELHHDFSVPSENVFNAWTDPEIMKKWMFKGETNDIVQVINNLEQNGAYTVVKKNANGEVEDYYGTYREIAGPNMLSFSLEAPEKFEGVSTVVVRIMPTENGSHMSFLQTGADPALFESAWKKMFERLEKILADA